MSASQDCPSVDGPIPPVTPRGGARRRRSWRRLRRWWRSHGWFGIGALWVLTFALGYSGLSRYLSLRAEPATPLDTIYLTLQLFTLESGSLSGPVGWELEVARFLAPAVAAYTAVRAVAELFRDELQLARLRVIRNHVIICGLGRKGYILTRALRNSGEPVVVIEQDEGNDLVELCRGLGAVVLFGSATDEESLVRAGVRRARHLVAVCGDDGINADVAVRAREAAANRPGRPLVCTVHVVDLQLCSLLRGACTGNGDSLLPHLQFFNVYDSGAEAMLMLWPPVDHSDACPPQLLVIGLGRFGESLVAAAARYWARLRTDEAAPLVVTIVDRVGEARVRSMCLRHPEVARICRLATRAMDVRGPEFQEGAILADDTWADAPVAAYVCLDNDALALSTGLSLLRSLGDRVTSVAVRMERDAGLASLLRGADGAPAHPKLHAFGLLDATCTPDRVLGAREVTSAGA